MDAALADADGMVLRGWGPQGIGFLSAERLARARRLRYGSTCHYAQAKFIDVDAAVAQGIAVSETAPVMSPWVAEYELALVLAALRSLPQEHETVGANDWVRWGDHPEWAEVPDRLHGRRVGLAGGIISRDVILALPRDAVFVLVSRMAVVEQAPLLERLTAGELRAGIDVYSPEPPPPDDPLRTLPNVIHTPHRAGGTYAAHLGVFLGQCHEGPPALRRRTATLPPAAGDGRYLWPIPTALADQRPRGVGGRCQAQPGSSAAQRSYTGSACPASLLRVRYHNADQVS